MFVECGSVFVQSLSELASSLFHKCWSVLIPVVWSKRKPKQAPTLTLLPLFHNTSAGECATLSESRTESPNESTKPAANIVFLSQAVLVLQCLVEFLCFERAEKWYKITEKLETDCVFIIPWFKFWFSFQINVFQWFCTPEWANLFRQTFSFSNYLPFFLIWFLPPASLPPPPPPSLSLGEFKNSVHFTKNLRSQFSSSTHILKTMVISICFFGYLCFGGFVLW